MHVLARALLSGDDATLMAVQEQVRRINRPGVTTAMREIEDLYQKRARAYPQSQIEKVALGWGNLLLEIILKDGPEANLTLTLTLYLTLKLNLEALRRNILKQETAVVEQHSMWRYSLEIKTQSRCS